MRAQQDEVERLRQVVFGARLNTADDAVGFLQTGDHDYWDVMPTLIGSEAFEHLEAVQVRHQRSSGIKSNPRPRAPPAPGGRSRSGSMVTVVAQAAE